jgi:hypothetical protein
MNHVSDMIASNRENSFHNGQVLNRPQNRDFEQTGITPQSSANKKLGLLPDSPGTRTRLANWPNEENQVEIQLMSASPPIETVIRDDWSATLPLRAGTANDG